MRKGWDGGGLQDGSTLLHVAIEHERFAIVRMLLAMDGVDPDIEDKVSTPLPPLTLSRCPPRV